MKDVELISELLAAIISGGPIHKKKAGDWAVGNTALTKHTLNKAVAEVSATLRAIKGICPELCST
jgi:hypothetical protein